MYVRVGGYSEDEYEVLYASSSLERLQRVAETLAHPKSERLREGARGRWVECSYPTGIQLVVKRGGWQKGWREAWTIVEVPVLRG